MVYTCPNHGAVAQLGERCVRNAEVGGSIPLGSIYLPLAAEEPNHRAAVIRRPHQPDEVDWPCLDDLPQRSIAMVSDHLHLL